MCCLDPSSSRRPQPSFCGLCDFPVPFCRFCTHPARTSPGFSFCLSDVCAPKRGIGGSGPSAGHTPSYHRAWQASPLHSASAGSATHASTWYWAFHLLGYPRFSLGPPRHGIVRVSRGQRDVSVALGHPPRYPHSVPTLLLRMLLALGRSIVPMARSLLFILFLALLRLLLAACSLRVASRSIPLRILASAVPSVPVEACVPLGTVACVGPGTNGRQARRAVRCVRSYACPPPRSRHGVLASLMCMIVSGCGHFSLPVRPSPFFPVACWVLLPEMARGMARSEGPEDRVGPPVPLPAPSSLPQTGGVTDVSIPWADPDRSTQAAAHVSVRDLPWAEQAADQADGRWLGCYVYTPHYTPVALAVDLPGSSDLQVALDHLLAYAPGTPEGLFDGIVPIRPQRFSGYLQVIRYPTILRQVHDGYAAVICNLTHVGGSYFATVLPRSLSHAELVAYLEPLTSVSDEPLRFFIGCRSKVWPLEANVLLRDGDAITGTFDPSGVPHRPRVEDLENRATWGTLRHFFKPELRDCTCVMYRDKRYCVNDSHHRGQSLNDYIASFLQLDLRRAASCLFRLRDLDVQGDRCADLIAVADVAPPTGGHNEPERQDIFVLCDLRPLGLKPRFLYTHVPRFHLPSLVADLGIALPDGFGVGVLGARVSGDTVRISGNCTLLFFARAISESSSSDVAIDECPEDTGLPEAVDDPTGFDTTIPAGHSWNVGEAAPWAAAAEDSHSVWDDRLGLFSRPEGPDASPWPLPGQDSYVLSGRQPQNGTVGESPGDVPMTGGDAERQAAPHESPRVPPSGPVTESQASSQGFEIVAVIYAPDVAPEMVATSLSLPCGVDQAVGAVASFRVPGASCGFSRLTPVTPQPCLEFMVLLASPQWLVSRPMVLMDCLRINSTLFAKVLFPYATRESLLLAAGLRHDAAEEVFVHGLLRPLQPGQRIQLLTGMVVSFAPPGCGAPATSDLATRLLSREGWDADALLPGPAYAPGMHYWVLTEGQPVLFTVGEGRRPHARDDLVRLLGASEHLLSVRPTQPGIVDALFNGHLTTGVWVATEQLSRIPFPPARVRENRIVLVLDCRPLLLGFRWLLLTDPIVPVHDITGPFQEYCPEEHVVTVSGAEAIEWGNEFVFQFSCGQVIVLSFADDISPSESQDAPPHDDFQDPPRTDDRDNPADDGGSGDPASAPPPGIRNRSRSPRPGVSRPTSGTGGSEALRLSRNEPCEGQNDMWIDARYQDAVVAGGASSTSDSSAPLNGSRLAVWLCWFGRCLFTDQLLAGSFSRQLFGLLQEEKCSRPVPVREAPAVTESSDAEELWELSELSFTLLAPEYQDEFVTLQLLLPQPAADVLDLLDTCRGRVGFDLFPRLCTVHPQPLDHSVTVLMLPGWPTSKVVICLDLSQCGGEVFAVATEPWLDRFALLNLAGLSVASHFTVVIPNTERSLQSGESVWVCNGDCVRFACPNISLRPLPSLPEVLAAPASWLSGRYVPRDPDDRYCLAGDGFYCDFVLHPERSFSYRSDIAARMGLPADRAIIGPARPRVENAHMYGRPCRSVIAVSLRDAAAGVREDHTGLLDCRPILEGWRRLLAPDGWLDLELLRERLSFGAPEGHYVSFSGCPDHWTWLWLEPGQVLRVVYSARSSAPAHGVSSEHPTFSHLHYVEYVAPPPPAQTQHHSPAPSGAQEERTPNPAPSSTKLLCGPPG